MAEKMKRGVIRISCSAIKHGETGEIICGPRHCHVIKSFTKRNMSILGNNSIQGFMTNMNDFVDRIEGAEIAIKSGQIEELNIPPNLYSEDLY